jgi:type IV pilus assembly protein PilV
MSERLRANQNYLTGTIDSNYLTGTGWIGTGDGNTTTDCSTLAVGEPRDVCEWRNSLNGAAEANGTSKVGAMVGARGCIIQLQAPDNTKNICRPGIYGVTVVWQGMTPTVAPPSSGLGACASGQFGTNDALRRSISARINVPLNQC